MVMASITKVSKVKTNTSDQFRTTIPKEVIDKFRIKGTEKILWSLKAKKISLFFIQDES